MAHSGSAKASRLCSSNDNVVSKEGNYSGQYAPSGGHLRAQQTLRVKVTSFKLNRELNVKRFWTMFTMFNALMKATIKGWRYLLSVNHFREIYNSDLFRQILFLALNILYIENFVLYMCMLLCNCIFNITVVHKIANNTVHTEIHKYCNRVVTVTLFF